jgi:hypothetical protein
MVEVAKTKWKVSVPKGADIKVAAGEKVKTGEVIASYKIAEVKQVSISALKNSEAVIKQWLGKAISEGEWLVKGGVFGGAFRMPIGGRIIGLDEFKNLLVASGTGERREIRAPTEMTVNKVEANKIVLEFKAEEFEGEGLVEGKVWGKIEPRLLENIGQIDSRLAGKIIRVRKLEADMVIKAEVVGVVGIISGDFREDLDNWEVKIPVLSLRDGERFDRRLEKEEAGMVGYLNCQKGKLLVV